MDETQPSPLLTELTEFEQHVVNTARRGEVAEPATIMKVEQLAVTDDPRLRVRADLLRDLLRGLHGNLDPHGIQIAGVRVVGQLDLAHVTAVTGLNLRKCALPDGILCQDARLRYLYLSRSLLTYLNADGLHVDGSLDMVHATVIGGEGAAIRLHNAHVVGMLNLDGATVTNTNGPALHADGLHADSYVFIRDATITGTGEGGAIRLLGAHIGGMLNLDQATVTNTNGPALHADGLHADDNVFIQDATITGTGEGGAIRLLGAHIGGMLNLDQATVTNASGAALLADNLRVDDNVFMQETTITGTGKPGAIRLHNAHIVGILSLDDATVTNTDGPALHAEALHADSYVFIRDATITGPGKLGAIHLISAHIAGTFGLDRASITNASGPALYADRLRVNNSLLMRNATIAGTGKPGAIRLAGAHLIGQADLLISRLDNGSGPLLVLDNVQIAGTLLFPSAMVCPSGQQGLSRRSCPDGARTIAARGLTYSTLDEISWRQWLHLLVHHTPTYWPQPFQQLAAVERAAGHDNNARHVLITQQHELGRRTPQALGNRLARGRHALWGWLGRYGYRAHRLVTALAVVLTLAAALSLLAGHVTTHLDHHAAERVPPATAKPADPGTPCSPVELIGLGIDRGLPLGTTGIRAHCDLDTTTGWGQTFTAILWALQAILWGLATLAIAAYTGLVRKPT